MTDIEYKNDEIQIYRSSDGQTQLDVKLDNQTVWLTQAQMVSLSETSKANISEHLKSVFESKELEKTDATVRKFRTVQLEGSRRVNRELEYFNLDIIISIGYRVNSRRGIQFRQWATERLKDYLVKGYAINQKRLDELSQMVSIIAQSTQSDDLKLNEAKGLLNVLSSYTQSYILLNQFDSNSLKTDNLNQNVTYEIKYEEARPEIDSLKQKLIIMLHIPCPHCGLRNENEFHYGAEAGIAYPEPHQLNDADWAKYLHIRSNPKGWLAERWVHFAGCGRWFNIWRNTVTHELGPTYLPFTQQPLSPEIGKNEKTKI